MEIAVINLQKKIRVSKESIERLIRAVLRLEEVCLPAQIAVSLVTDAQIRELNTLYLGRYCSTDVLSFDISRSKKELAADIAVSTDTAFRNAKKYHTSPRFEIYLYVAHGLLHLLGYDDINLKQRKKMQERAEFILNSLKIKKYGNQ